MRQYLAQDELFVDHGGISPNLLTPLHDLVRYNYGRSYQGSAHSKSELKSVPQCVCHDAVAEYKQVSMHREVR